MSNAVLVDLTLCIGCRSCQVACKTWNDNPAEDTICTGSYENPPNLSATTWTRVRFTEVEDYGVLKWAMNKTQCMHCLTPACAAICPMQVHQKTESGAVIHEEGKCIGCRSCGAACPFGIPNLEWQDGLPEITKCKFCTDRTSNGEEPACVKACSTGGLTFGDRTTLLAAAKKRIRSNPEKYVDHIYGEKEVGGTSWLYLSHVNFEDLGFPTLSEEPVDISMLPRPNFYPSVDREQKPTEAINVGATSGLVGVAIGAAGAIAAMQLLKERKDKLKEEARDE